LTGVAAGRYRSADDVVQAGLRLLKKREESGEATPEEIRREILLGLEQAKRGELIDGKEAMREHRRRLEERRGS
jgi:antitoxin ParD1/3/4